MRCLLGIVAVGVSCLVIPAAAEAFILKPLTAEQISKNIKLNKQFYPTIPAGPWTRTPATPAGRTMLVTEALTTEVLNSAVRGITDRLRDALAKRVPFAVIPTAEAQAFFATDRSGAAWEGYLSQGGSDKRAWFDRWKGVSDALSRYDFVVEVEWTNSGWLHLMLKHAVDQQCFLSFGLSKFFGAGKAGDVEFPPAVADSLTRAAEAMLAAAP